MRCVAVLSFFVTLCPLAASASDCGKLPTATGLVGYCVDHGDRTKNPDILYYFHGAAPDVVADPERGWSGTELDVLGWFDRMHIARPTVISVSWGRRWILKDEKLSDFRVVVAALERRLPAAGNGRRMVLGASMGGLNAYLAWTQLPAMFDAAAFQCPAFTQESPTAPWLRRVVLAELRGTSHSDAGFLNMFSDLLKPLFASSGEWLRYQPPEMMKRLAGRKLPPAYLIHDTADQFGFNGAPEIGAAGQPIAYEAVAGGHCEGVASEGLARFLAGSEKTSAAR